MIRYLSYVSFFILLCYTTISCSKSTYASRIESPSIVAVGTNVNKYNLNLNFGKKHFNGMIAVRQMDSKEIRIIGYTTFGLSLFDFGIVYETFIIHNCIEPMRNKKLLNILENDFKLLFLPNRDVKKIESQVDYTKFAKGKFLSKCVIISAIDSTTNNRNILIKHPYLKLSIELEEIN